MRLVGERRLAVGDPVRIDGSVEGVEIVGARLGDHGQVVLALVGIGFQMRRIRVENRAVDQLVGNRLSDDRVEDVLGDGRVVEATTAVLAERRGVEHAIGQLQPQEPAIGDIDLDLAHQLALRADAKQIADEQCLEHQRRIERRTAVVGAVESRNPVMDEGEVDHRVDLAKQVVLRHQTVESHHLDSRLFRSRFLQHVPVNHKPPAKARGLSAV